MHMVSTGLEPVNQQNTFRNASKGTEKYGMDGAHIVQGGTDKSSGGD